MHRRHALPLESTDTKDAGTAQAGEGIDIHDSGDGARHERNTELARTRWRCPNVEESFVVLEFPKRKEVHVLPGEDSTPHIFERLCPCETSISQMGNYAHILHQRFDFIEPIKRAMNSIFGTSP